MPALDIARLGAGDRIQHELLVFRAERRETREGVGFVLLELGNATGRIVARVWSEHEPEIRGVRPDRSSKSLAPWSLSEDSFSFG